MRKFWGIVLIIVGILFVLIAMVRITSILELVLRHVNIFKSGGTSYNKGQLFGGVIYWFVHFTVIYFSFKHGFKLTKKKKTKLK